MLRKLTPLHWITLVAVLFSLPTVLVSLWMMVVILAGTIERYGLPIHHWRWAVYAIIVTVSLGLLMFVAAWFTGKRNAR